MTDRNGEQSARVRAVEQQVDCECCAQRGLTLSAASRLLGVDRHTLRGLELGDREARYPTLAKLAKGYGVPVEELLEEEPAVSGKVEAPHWSDDPPGGRGPISPEAAAEAERVVGLLHEDEERVAYAEGADDGELDEVIHALHDRLSRLHRRLRGEKEAGRRPPAELYRRYAAAADAWFVLTLLRDLRGAPDPEAEPLRRRLEAFAGVG